MGFDAGEKLCHSPSRKSGLHAASCHDVPCYVLALPDWLYSSSLIIS